MVIHGPTVVSFANARQETIDSFYNTLTGSSDKINIQNKNIIKPGKCTGILKGGNIATISHLLGTRFQPDFKDTILFLEDIGESAYKIDRMLTQMKMASVFDGIQGVITGSFEKCDNNEYLDDILLETFEAFDIPIISGLDCGHGKINLSLCLGATIEMDTNPGHIFWK
jgi:muramoyltetrapeptide carboxypeptidase